MLKIDYAVVSEQGKRREIEDAYSFGDTVDGPLLFAGVFDGHGGSDAAWKAAASLHQVFFARLKRRQKPEAAVREAYLSIDKALDGTPMGTTAATLLLKRNNLVPIIYHANVGDSRILVVNEKSEDGERQLSIDDRVDNLTEANRVIRAGGVIRDGRVRGEAGGLMMTRALGDPDFKSAGVIAEPHVGRYLLRRNDRWIVVACDGLFDFVTNQEVGDACRTLREPKAIAQRLKTLVLDERNGSDNLTVIVLKLIRS